jgi:thioredoxin-like negative regulator of GroEL
VHATVNTDAEQELIARMRVFAVPYLMAFRDRAAVYSHPGALTAPELDELPATLSGLAVPEVHATMVSDAAATPA